MAYLADFGDTFAARPWLGALVEEHDLGIVDDVGLNTTYVNKFLNLTHPSNIMV